MVVVAGGRGGECTDMSTHSNTEEVKRREERVCRVCVLCVCVYAAGSHISCVQVALAR